MMENIPNNLPENAEFPHPSPPQSETAHDGGRPSENGVGGVSDNQPEHKPDGADSQTTQPAPKTQPSKKSKRKKRNTKRRISEIGTAKGVETMFRNAVRSEMELLALAATKANIMISLNGFIVSALMISGAFIFSSSPEFLIPASTFMITAAASIVFALLSASPERIGKVRANG